MRSSGLSARLLGAIGIRRRGDQDGLGVCGREAADSEAVSWADQRYVASGDWLIRAVAINRGCRGQKAPYDDTRRSELLDQQQRASRRSSLSR